MKKLIKYLSVSLLSLVLLLSSGCINTGAKDSGGFDLVKILQNPFVMVIGMLVIFWFMWSKRK